VGRCPAGLRSGWWGKELKRTCPRPTPRALTRARQASGSRAASGSFPQEPGYVAKTLLLELLQYGFEGCRAVNGAMRARLGAPGAVVEAHEVP
jgi:hypothetical protein